MRLPGERRIQSLAAVLVGGEGRRRDPAVRIASQPDNPGEQVRLSVCLGAPAFIERLGLAFSVAEVAVQDQGLL